MVYIKRVLFLLLLVGLSILANDIRPELNTRFSLGTIGLALVNILFVISLIVAFNVSKEITRSVWIIGIEIIILALLLSLSFLPQLDELSNHKITNQIKIFNNSSFVNYMQMIFGFWIISFTNIMKNKNFRRNSLTNSIRYMRS